MQGARSSYFREDWTSKRLIPSDACYKGYLSNQFLQLTANELHFKILKPQINVSNTKFISTHETKTIAVSWTYVMSPLKFKFNHWHYFTVTRVIDLEKDGKVNLQCLTEAQCIRYHGKRQCSRCWRRWGSPTSERCRTRLLSHPAEKDKLLWLHEPQNTNSCLKAVPWFQTLPICMERKLKGSCY